MTETEALQTQVRSLENECRALRETLWDRYFTAACSACLHLYNGKMSGIAAAAEIADEMMRVRKGKQL